MRITHHAPRLPVLPPSADDVGHLEDGQEHADDHAANDDDEENDEDRLDESGQTGEGGFDFLIEEIRDALEHVVNLAGLFAGGDHADNHAGEDGMFAEGGGNALAAFDVEGGGF